MNDSIQGPGGCRVFQRQCNLSNHGNHHREPLICDICKNNGKEHGFSTANNLNRHKKIFHRASSQHSPFACFICGEDKGAGQASFNEHLQRQHNISHNEIDIIANILTIKGGSNRKPTSELLNLVPKALRGAYTRVPRRRQRVRFKCPHCDTEYTKEHEKHITTCFILKTIQAPFKPDTHRLATCPLQCGHPRGPANSIMTHVMQAHLEHLVTQYIKVRHQEFNAPQQNPESVINITPNPLSELPFGDNYRIIKGPSEGSRAHPCSISDCPEAFYTQAALRKHTNRHIKPFICKFCKDNGIDCGFATKNDLNRHEVGVHLALNQVVTFVCPKCTKGGGRREDNFMRHLQTQHGIPKAVAKRITEDSNNQRHGSETPSSSEIKKTSDSAAQTSENATEVTTIQPPEVIVSSREGIPLVHNIDFTVEAPSDLNKTQHTELTIPDDAKSHTIATGRINLPSLTISWSNDPPKDSTGMLCNTLRQTPESVPNTAPNPLPRLPSSDSVSRAVPASWSNAWQGGGDILPPNGSCSGDNHTSYHEGGRETVLVENEEVQDQSQNVSNADWRVVVGMPP